MKIDNGMILYEQNYIDIDFERQHLFECIERNFKPRRVIYLGCHVHITPSFVFPDVTYIDTSEQARLFFQDIHLIKRYVAARKIYKERAAIQFLHQDYTSIELDTKYDMCIALYAPSSFAAGHTFLDRNGFFVYLPLPSDFESNSLRHLYQPEGCIYCKNKREYVFSRETPHLKRKKKKHGKSVIFREENVYHVYKNRN